MTSTPSRWRGAVRVLAVLLAFSAGFAVRGCGDDAAPGGVDVPAASAAWTCSMHPQIRQDEAGACPICGMDLVPVGGVGDDGPPDRVVLSERARALAGLRTTPVRRQGDAAAALHLLGRVEPSETARRNVTTWIGGRIDRLLVNTTGESVRPGQVLATLYSPEVYAAHQDLMTAHRQVARLAEGTPAARQAADAALAAARDRLRLLGVPEEEIDAMAGADAPRRSVPIRSPFAGTVLERVATEGAYVETGATLYQIADLSTLWVQLDAYARDLTRLSVGQAVLLSVDALPDRVFEGRVAFLDPTLDPVRRTARVRVEVDNADGLLRPGMYAEARVAVADPDEAAPLVVPATAPLFTGRRSLVYVEERGPQGPAYRPREVRLGPRLGDVYPVVSGLSDGERVVSRGAFVVDADLQIRGGPSMMTLTDDREAPGPALALSPTERAPLAPVVSAYLDVQRRLAADDLDGALDAADRVVQATNAVALPPAAEAAWSELGPALRLHARSVSAAEDLEAARGGFEPLSAGVESLLATFGNPLDEAVHVAFCPMAHDDQGARWVQAGTDVDNAYFGAAMRTCGEIRAAVPPGSHLDAGSVR